MEFRQAVKDIANPGRLAIAASVVTALLLVLARAGLSCDDIVVGNRYCH
jgi:hypothetical protein